MGYCDSEISADIEPNCDDTLVMGIEQEGVIMNRRDVDFDGIVYSSTNKSIVETLLLKDAVKGYRVVIPTKNPFTGTGTTLNEGTARNSFVNTVGMVIMADDPDVSENIIDGLANGEFVVIIENKNKNLQNATAAKKGFSTFQIYGLLQGLRATEISKDKYSADTEGGWNVVLTEEGVPKSSLYFFKTDIETTRAAVKSLTTT